MTFPATLSTGQYVIVDASFINFNNNSNCNLDVNSTFSCSGGFGLNATSPTVSSSPQNDYNMNGSTSFNGASIHAINNTSGGTLNITGVVEGFDGQFKWLVNKSASGDSIVLKHNDSGSSSRNRFLCAGEADITLAKYEWARIFYLNGDGKWYASKNS